MLRRLYAQLPDFARPDHPVMRYMLLREGRRSARRSTALRVAGGALLLAALAAAGWWIATDFGRGARPAPNPLDDVFLIAFWPLVALQLLLRVLAFNATIGIIAGETQRGTWDTLKITTDGALLSLRARWAIAFYRLWPLLALLLIFRLLFVVGALVNLASFQGRYLDLMLSGTVPFGPPNVDETTSVVTGILIVAAMMTTALLAPFTAVAFDAGLGMYISTYARGRTLSLLGQVLVILARVLLTLWALWIGAAALDLTLFTALTTALPPPGDQPIWGWLGGFIGIVEGDLGLTLLHLPYYPRMWADYDYGILIGAACLAYVLIQAAVANMLVRRAARRAAQPDAM
jgi:hypothetical protein